MRNDVTCRFAGGTNTQVPSSNMQSCGQVDGPGRDNMVVYLAHCKHFCVRLTWFIRFQRTDIFTFLNKNSRTFHGNMLAVYAPFELLRSTSKVSDEFSEKNKFKSTVIPICPISTTSFRICPSPRPARAGLLSER